MWGDHFDGALADLFDLQDQVASGVVGAMIPVLNQAAMMHARRKPASNPTALGFLLARACADAPSSDSGRGNRGHAALLPCHRTRCPNSLRPGASSGSASWCSVTTAGRRRRQPRRRPKSGGWWALSADRGSEDAVALCAAGYALLFVCGEIETGAAMIDRGLALNPNHAGGWRLRGWASLCRAGTPRHWSSSPTFSPSTRSIRKTSSLNAAWLRRWSISGATTRR